KDEYYSYGQCGLPYVISGVVESFDDLIARSLQTFREKYKMDARIGTIVESINFNEQTVSVKSKETNNQFEVEYDKLLIASGASSIYPEMEGNQLNGIHKLGTIPDAKELLKDLDDDVNNVTIIGGGYIGLEAAENIAELGKKVTLIQRGNQVANILDRKSTRLNSSHVSISYAVF